MDTFRSVHSQLSLCQLPALYLLREEKNSRGGNKDTLPLSFRNPCLWRGFFLAYVGRLTFATRGYALMRLRVALLLVGAISVIGRSANANQMFPAGGRSGTACPSGSQYKGSGFCKAKKPDYQFFHAGGSSAFLPQWVLIQRECFLPNSLTCRTWGSCGKPLFFFVLKFPAVWGAGAHI